MLPDSAHIQEKDFEYLEKRGRAGPEARPLYTLADAVRVQKLMIAVPYHRIHHLRKNLSLEFLDAGHILGSASIDLRIAEGGPHRLVFSGDIGRNGLPIIRDPEPPTGPIDTLIIESTYAERDHESVAGSEERLGEAIRRTAARGGKVLVPSFAVGRTQELVYSINQLFRAGKIPHIPVYVDSPLAVDVTSVFRLHPETFDQSEMLVESARPCSMCRSCTTYATWPIRRRSTGWRGPPSSSPHRAWPRTGASSIICPITWGTTARSCCSSASRRRARWAGASRMARRR